MIVMSASLDSPAEQESRWMRIANCFLGSCDDVFHGKKSDIGSNPHPGSYVSLAGE